MVMVHVGNTRHITVPDTYMPPPDSTSTHWNPVDTDMQCCMRHITGIPHSVLTGDVNAHSTLWHSYTDDHRGKQMANVISNSDQVTTMPINMHTSSGVFVGIMLAGRHNVPNGKIHSVQGHTGKQHGESGHLWFNFQVPRWGDTFWRKKIQAGHMGGRDRTLTVITGTPHTFFGRPWIVYPIEHLQQHFTCP